MKKIVIFIPLLLTGFLASAQANGEVPDENGTVLFTLNGLALLLQFPDSSSCRVHASGGNLLVVAANNKNTKAQLEHLKLDYKAIRDLIVAQAKNTKKK